MTPQVVRELSPVVAPVLAMYDETRRLDGIVGEVGSPGSRHSSGSRGMNDSGRERSSSTSSVSSFTAPTDRHPHAPDPDMGPVGVGIDQPEPILTSGRGDGKSKQRLSGLERREEGAGTPPPRDPSSPSQALLWESRGSNRSTDSEMEALTGPRLSERGTRELPPLVVKAPSPKSISPLVNRDGGPLPWGTCEAPTISLPGSEHEEFERLPEGDESLGPDAPTLRDGVY
jgi:hypothetical protein